MSFSRLSSKMKNEEGSGLILALMTLLVLSVLGASLGAVTIGSYKLGQNTQDDTSAYYIAEAGANMAYEEMKAGVMKVYEKNLPENSFFESEEGVEGVKAAINTASDYKFEEQSGDIPTAEVLIEEVSNSNPRSYVINSVGKVDGKTRTVHKALKVLWKEKNTDTNIPSVPANASIIGKEKIDISGNQIVGDIYISSKKNNSVNLTYTDIEKAIIFHKQDVNPNELINYPNWNKPKIKIMKNHISWSSYESIVSNLPEFPNYSYKENSRNIKLQGGGGLVSIKLNDNTAFDSIVLKSNKTLELDIGSKNINITVDNLNMDNGHIKVKGTGKLTIFVKNQMPFGASSSINKDGNSSKVKFYYFGQSELRFSGSQEINGSLFVEKADVYIEAGSGIKGVIMSGGSEIILDGGTTASPFIVAPRAIIDIAGGARFEGVVIGNTINVLGGARIIYKAFDIGDFPFVDNSEDSVGGSTPPSDQIISSDPAIEAN